MKERKRAAGVALLLLAFASVVFFWISRREPPPERGANATAPGPAVNPGAPLATAAEPAALPPAASNVALSTEVAGSNEGDGLQRPAVTRAAKEPRKLAAKASATADDRTEPEALAAVAPAASAQPAAEPTHDAPPATPAAKAPQKPADGSASGRFQNRVGPSFALARVVCQVDGQTVYSGPGGSSVQLFQRNLAPGSHAVSVVAEYRGNSAGVFSYAQGFRFKVTSGRHFNVQSGKPVQVSITGYEKGGPTDAFSERLALAVSAR